MLFAACDHRERALIRWFQWLTDAVAAHKNVGAVLELFVDEVFLRLQLGRLRGDRSHEIF